MAQAKRGAELKRVARIAWSCLVAVAILAAVLAVVLLNVNEIEWATRPVALPAASSSAVATREPVSAVPVANAPDTTVAVTNWAREAVSSTLGGAFASSRAGGDIPGACSGSQWPVVVSAYALDPQTGVHATIAVTTAGEGADAEEKAVRLASSCTGSVSAVGYSDWGTYTEVTAQPSLSWKVARYRDIIVVVAAADGKARSAASGVLDQLMETARTESGCDAFASQGDSPYRNGYTYLTDTERLELAPVTDARFLPDPSEYLPSPQPTPGSISEDSEPISPEPNTPSAVLPTPVPELAPLVPPQRGGNGVMTGIAPLLVNPDDIPEPDSTRPLASGEEPALPRLSSDFNLPIPVHDARGPGCGWSFVGTVPPSPPSAQEVREAKLDGYLTAAEEQTRDLARLAEYPLLMSRFLSDIDSQAQWEAYDEAVEQARRAWRKAEREYEQSLEPFRQPTPTPSPSTLPTPTPTPTPAPPSPTPTPTPAVTEPGEG